MLFILLADVHAAASFNYGIAHKENISGNTIRLVIYIQNNDRQDIEPGTVYDISINEYEGEFTVAKPIKQNRTGKRNYLHIWGSLGEQV